MALLFFDTFTAPEASPGGAIHAHVIHFDEPVLPDAVWLVPADVAPFADWPNLRGSTRTAQFSVELFAGLRRATPHSDAAADAIDTAQALQKPSRYTRWQPEATPYTFEQLDAVQTIAVPPTCKAMPINSIVLRGDFSELTVCVLGRTTLDSWTQPPALALAATTATPSATATATAHATTYVNGSSLKSHGTDTAEHVFSSPATPRARSPSPAKVGSAPGSSNSSPKPPGGGAVLPTSTVSLIKMQKHASGRSVAPRMRKPAAPKIEETIYVDSQPPSNAPPEPDPEPKASVRQTIGLVTTPVPERAPASKRTAVERDRVESEGRSANVKDSKLHSSTDTKERSTVIKSRPPPPPIRRRLDDDRHRERSDVVHARGDSSSSSSASSSRNERGRTTPPGRAHDIKRSLSPHAPASSADIRRSVDRMDLDRERSTSKRPRSESIPPPSTEHARLRRTRDPSPPASSKQRDRANSRDRLDNRSRPDAYSGKDSSSRRSVQDFVALAESSNASLSAGRTLKEVMQMLDDLEHDRRRRGGGGADLLAELQDELESMAATDARCHAAELLSEEAIAAMRHPAASQQRPLVDTLPEHVRNTMEPALVTALIGSDQSRLFASFFMSEPHQWHAKEGLAGTAQLFLDSLQAALAKQPGTDDGTAAEGQSAVVLQMEEIEQHMLLAVAAAAVNDVLPADTTAAASSSINGLHSFDRSREPFAADGSAAQLVARSVSAVAAVMQDPTSRIADIAAAARALAVIGNTCCTVNPVGEHWFALFGALEALSQRQPLSVFSVLDLLRGMIRASESPLFMEQLVRPTAALARSVLAAWLQRLLATKQPPLVTAAAERLLEMASLFQALDQLKQASAAVTAASVSRDDTDIGRCYAMVECHLTQLSTLLPRLLSLTSGRTDVERSPFVILTVLRYVDYHTLTTSLATVASMHALPRAAETVLCHVLCLLLRCPELRLWLVARPTETRKLLWAMQSRASKSPEATDPERSCHCALALLPLTTVPSWQQLEAALSASLRSAELLAQLRQPSLNGAPLVNLPLVIQDLAHVISNETGKEALASIASTSRALSALANLLDSALAVLSHRTNDMEEDLLQLLVRPARDVAVAVFGQTDVGVAALVSDPVIATTLTQWPSDWPSAWTCQSIMEPVGNFAAASGGVRSVVSFTQRLLASFPVDDDSDTRRSTSNTSAGTAAPVASATAERTSTSASTGSAGSVDTSSTVSQQPWQALLNADEEAGLAQLEALGVSLRLLYLVSGASHSHVAPSLSTRASMDANLTALAEAPVFAITSSALRMAAQGLRLAHMHPANQRHRRGVVPSALLLNVATPAVRLLQAFLESFYSDGKMTVQTRLFLPPLMSLLSSLAMCVTEHSDATRTVHAALANLLSRLVQVKTSTRENAPDLVTVEPLFQLHNSGGRPLLAELAAFIVEHPANSHVASAFVALLLPPPPGISLSPQNIWPGLGEQTVPGDHLIDLRRSASAYRDIAAVQLETFLPDLPAVVATLALSSTVGASSLKNAARLLQSVAELGRPLLARAVVHGLLDTLVHLVGPYASAIQTMANPRAAAVGIPLMVCSRRAPPAAVTAALNSFLMDEALSGALRSLPIEQALGAAVLTLFVLANVVSTYCGQMTLRTLRGRAGIVITFVGDIIKLCWAADGNLVLPKTVRTDSSATGGSALASDDFDLGQWLHWSTSARQFLLDDVLPALQNLYDPALNVTVPAADATPEMELRLLSAVTAQVPLLSSSSFTVPLHAVPDLSRLFDEAPSILFPGTVISLDVEQFVSKQVPGLSMTEALRRLEMIPGAQLVEAPGAQDTATSTSTAALPARSNKPIPSQQPRMYSRPASQSRPASLHVDLFQSSPLGPIAAKRSSSGGGGGSSRFGSPPATPNSSRSRHVEDSYSRR